MSLSAATFTVTTTAPTGAGSLGQAITSANGSAGLDTIVFAIGSGPQTIAASGVTFPPITDAVIIDGTTQPGFAGSPIIEINATGYLNAVVLFIQTSGCTIKGLVINRQNGDAIDIFGDSNTIQGNYLGTDITGSLPLPNVNGVTIISGANNLIGGSSSAARNVISGNLGGGVTVGIAPPINANRVEGNYVGINAAGTAAVSAGVGAGIQVGFGATNTAIVANVTSGLQLGMFVGSTGTTGTVITGNFIGTNPTGTSAIANTSGVFVSLGPTNTTIGGTTPAERNIISGNTSTGVQMSGSATGVQVIGNYIGVNASGTASIKNGTGVRISGSSGNIVGGAAAGSANIISGNGTGVLLQGDSNIISGNLIGTDVTGNVAIANTSGGVSIIVASTNLVTGNVISGNANGIGVNGTGNVITGNRIGVNAAGSAALGNTALGISVSSATNTLIGGTTPAARNVISANGSAGVLLSGTSAGTVIQGNAIGTDLAGTANLGNKQDGIAVIPNASGVLIGGAVAGAGNVISFNGGSGVFVSGPPTPPPDKVTISRNSISSNTRLGIDFGFGNPVLNDPGDADTGPNNLQNYPVLTSATLGSGTTTVTGTLNSTPSSTFTIELFDNLSCDSSGSGEGATFVTSTIVTTDASGNASFSLVLPLAMTVVTATATDAAGNTSEFSACLGVASFSINDVTVTEGTGGTTTATFTVTRSPAITTTSTVQFATSNGSATTPADYATTGGTLTFNPGDATKTISVSVVPDNIDETNELFFVNLSNATGAAISRPTGVGTITDDDTSMISISDAPMVLEGTPAVFTVTLSVPSATSIVVNYSTADNTATAGTRYTATSGTLTFAPGEVTKTISVPTLTNSQPDPTGLFFVNLTSTATIARAQGVGTIIDSATVPLFSPLMLLLIALTLAATGVISLRR